MAQPNLEDRLYSEEEYLAFEEASEEKHEFWFGRVVAMAGAKDNHNSLTAQAITAINRRLDDSSCQATGSDQRVRLQEGEGYAYPDVVVRCEDARWQEKSHLTLLNPRVLIEVLSSSTGARDWNVKLPAYKLIPELLDYLIVSPVRVGIEHFRRTNTGTWESRSYNRRDQIIHLAFENLEIPVGEIYRRVDVPEQLVLWDEDEG
jgi:Uma2 family endonuclease